MALRFAVLKDCAAMLGIYAQYIDTSITFEQTLPTEEEFAARLRVVQKAYPWLVWEEDGRILGYAYAHPFAERVSYLPSAELSVYVDKDARGKKLGKKLYLALMEILKLQNVKTVYGLVTSPNARSEALHEALGFRREGRLCNVGYKNGWRDVSWFSRSISSYGESYEGFVPIGALEQEALQNLLNPEQKGPTHMDIRLIAFDLDGTLLREDKTISPRTMRALLAAREKGVWLVPATGRLYRALPDALKAPELCRYQILINGAQIFDAREETVLVREELTKDLAQKMLAHLKTRNVVRTVYLAGQGWMAKEDYENLDKIAQSPAALELMRKIYRVTDDLDALAAASNSAQKVIAFFKDLDEKAAALEEMPKAFPDYAISTSIINNIEINAKNATKGAALRALCEKLGLSLSQCMAFGDDTNDCSMLRAAGLGVAMGNAAEKAKACADEIAPTNEEDGLAQIIERVLGL